MNSKMYRVEKLRIPSKVVTDENSIVISLDVGSEFVKAAYWNPEDGCSSIISVDGCSSIPTAIAYSDEHDYVIGNEAIQALRVSPKSVIQHFPLLIGNEVNEEIIKMICKTSVSEIVLSDEKKAMWQIINKNCSIKKSLMDICIDYFSMLIPKIEERLDKKVVCMFIVVNSISPAISEFYHSLSSALSIELELIQSFTSMCLSYGFFEDNIHKKLLLLDFGWSSVRIQIIENNNNEYHYGPYFESFALSGESLFLNIIHTIECLITKDEKEILDSNYFYRNKLNMNAYSCLNHTKKLLDLQKFEKQQDVNDRKISLAVTSAMFQSVAKEQIEMFDKNIHDFFTSNSLSLDEFDDILVSGGVANCNYVYDYIQQTFKNTFFPDLLTIYNPNNNMNECVLVNGAAIQCASWMGVSFKDLKSLLLIDLLPHDICMKTEEGYEIVFPKGCSIPTRKSMEVSLESEDQEELIVEIYRRDESDENEFIKIGEFNFKLNKMQIEDPSSIGVVITLSESGRISATCSGSYEPDINTQNVIMLLIALVFLIIAYIFLKFFFHDNRIRLGYNPYMI